jgi:hypothetical protein
MVHLPPASHSIVIAGSSTFCQAGHEQAHELAHGAATYPWACCVVDWTVLNCSQVLYLLYSKLSQYDHHMLMPTDMSLTPGRVAQLTGLFLDCGQVLQKLCRLLVLGTHLDDL